MSHVMMHGLGDCPKGCEWTLPVNVVVGFDGSKSDDDIVVGWRDPIVGTMKFYLTDVNRDMQLALYPGGALPEPEPAPVSLVLDTVTPSWGPAYPAEPKGWRRFIPWAGRNAHVAWSQRHQEWVANGRPSDTTRPYFPSVRLETFS